MSHPRFAVLLCLLVSSACALENAEVEGLRIAMVGDGTVDDGTQQVDLQTPTAYVFEEGAMGSHDLALVCPNGQRARLGDWLALQRDAIRERFTATVSVAASEVHAESALLVAVPPPRDCDCSARCDACPDGAVICYFDCNLACAP